MADEQIGQIEPLAQLEEQPQHRRLHRHVQSRRRLVQDHQARPQHQNARQTDAALLSTADLVRIEIEMRLRQPDRRQHLAHACSPLVGGQLRYESPVALPARGRSSSADRATLRDPGSSTARSAAAPCPRAATAHRPRCPRTECRRCWLDEFRRSSCPAWSCRSLTHRRRRGCRRARTDSVTPSTARSHPVRRPHASRIGKCMCTSRSASNASRHAATAASRCG